MIDLIKPIIPWIVYSAVFGVAFYGALKKAEWGIYLLVVLIPLPALWYPIHSLPFGKDSMDILILSCTIGSIYNKNGFKSPKGSSIVWIFMAVSFASLLNLMQGFGLGLESGWESISNWKNYVEMIILYFLAYSIFDDESRQEVLVTLIGLIVLLIAVRAFRNFEAGSAFSYDKRSAGPFDLIGLNPNHFAAFIAHFGCFLLGMCLVDKNKWRVRLFLVAALFCLHPLFFAYSRGAYIAVLVVLLLYGILQYRLILVILVALAFTWQVALPDTVVERISMTSDENGKLEDSAAERIVLWEKAQQMFRDNPVFGIGFTGFEYSMRDQNLRNTHNFFMQTAAEQGVVGLLTLFSLFARGFWVAWHLYRGGRSDFHRAIGLGFIGCTSAVLITNIFGDRFSQFAVGGYFFIIFGIAERALDSARSRPILVGK